MTAKFNSFIITATYTGSKCAPWGNGRENWNHHTVTVRNTATGKKTSFDFWASIANPELTSEYDIVNAFYCFLQDACSGSESFTEFCADFGYDEDSRSAERTWKACKRAAAKFERIAPDSDIYELLNSMEEYA